jgi:hypothetical protein
MSVDYYRNFSDLHATNRTPYKTNLLWYSLVYLRALFRVRPWSHG